MAQAITTLQTVSLNTTLSGGIQPYDPCTTWMGSYTAGNGTTGMLPINGNPYPPGVAYIESSSGVCPLGSLTGTFYPNGFTGDVGLWVYAKDASGIADESNHLEYTVILEDAFNVSAGPDVTINNTSYTLQGAISGGTQPYNFSWATITKPSGAPNPVYTPTYVGVTGPLVTNLVTDGTYTFRLAGADSASHTGSDSVNIVVTGQTPATIDYPLYWFNQIGTTSAGKSSILTIWHQPADSLVWNQIVTNTATTTTGFTGTVILDLASQYGDQIKVNVKGTNTYKSLETWAVAANVFDNYLLDGFSNSTSAGITGTYYVDSDYVQYNVYGWTDYSLCLGIGSLIKMADGSEIKVENLKVGDSVASLNIENSEKWRGYASVEFTPEPINTKVSSIQTLTHDSYVRINNDFNVSESHPLFVFRDNYYKFIEANKLDLMDKLISETGELINITAIDIINEPLQVYLVSTDPSHIYIANGVINHNKRATISPEPSTGLT